MDESELKRWGVKQPLSRANAAGGRGCLVLMLGFGAAVLAVALWALTQAIRRADEDQIHKGINFVTAWTLLLIGAVWLLVRAGRPEARLDERPWLGRRDWARGVINNSGALESWKSALLAGVMFYYANACAEEVVNTPDIWVGAYAILAVLLVVGINSLRKAAYAAIRFMRFGTSQLTLVTLPGEIGGRIAGTVRAPRGVRAGVRITGHLQCVRVTVKRDDEGDNRGTKERIVRQEQQSFESARDCDGRTKIPVEFFIPPNATPSRGFGSDDQIVWRIVLEDASRFDGYRASFDVPVFDQKPEPPEVTAE